MQLIYLFIVLFLSLACGGMPSFATDVDTFEGVTILGIQGSKGGVFIPPRELEKEGAVFLSMDPNFEPAPLVPYTGVPLGRVMKWAGAGPVRGVTVVGRDQYAVYVSAELMANPGVGLVWEREEEPLSNYRGGPLKLLFPPELAMHVSAYCWYVETLIPDPGASHGLTVKIDGKSKVYNLSELDAMAHEEKHLYLSIPLGYRWNLPKLVQPSTVAAIPLSSLLGDADLTGKHVTLTPLPGRAMTLPVASLLSCEVLLVYRINGAPIHPAYGGPFSLYFPVITCRALEGIAPETASLFFLNEISID